MHFLEFADDFPYFELETPENSTPSIAPSIERKFSHSRTLVLLRPLSAPWLCDWALFKFYSRGSKIFFLTFRTFIFPNTFAGFPTISTAQAQATSTHSNALRFMKLGTRAVV